MARPYSNLKVMICRSSFASIAAWLPGFALATLAQNTIVAGEAKAPVTHQGNSFLEALFPILNNIALVALIGVVIFGLIWLVQRKKGEDVTTAEGEAQSAEEKAPAETEPASASETAPTAESVTNSETADQSKSEVVAGGDKTEEADAEKSV